MLHIVGIVKNVNTPKISFCFSHQKKIRYHINHNKKIETIIDIKTFILLPGALLLIASNSHNLIFLKKLIEK
jgi:hypothetical protein